MLNVKIQTIHILCIINRDPPDLTCPTMRVLVAIGMLPQVVTLALAKVTTNMSV